MSDSLELTEILEKEEAEEVYRRELTDKEWEIIKYNLKARFFSRIRKEMLSLIEDMPDYFLSEK